MNVWRVVGLVNRSLRGVLVGEIEDSHHRAAPKSAKLDINIYFPTNQTQIKQRQTTIRQQLLTVLPSLHRGRRFQSKIIVCWLVFL